MTYSKYLEKWDKEKEKIKEDELNELINSLKLTKFPCEGCGYPLYKIDEYTFYCKVCDEMSVYSFPIEDEYE